jgi:hypothetical protein
MTESGGGPLFGGRATCKSSLISVSVFMTASQALLARTVIPPIYCVDIAINIKETGQLVRIDLTLVRV